MSDDLELHPDWSQTFTPVEAEYQLEGFKWRGPGWYHQDDDTALAVELGDTGRYHFYFWNNRNPIERIRQILNLPQYND